VAEVLCGVKVDRLEVAQQAARHPGGRIGEGLLQPVDSALLCNSADGLTLGQVAIRTGPLRAAAPARRLAVLTEVAPA